MTDKQQRTAGITTITDTHATVLLAFWHRTRREIVPMIAEEVATKTGLTRTAATHAIGCLTHAGLLSGQRIKKEITVQIYEPTPRGERLIARAIQRRTDSEVAA